MDYLLNCIFDMVLIIINLISNYLALSIKASCSHPLSCMQSTGHALVIQAAECMEPISIRIHENSGANTQILKWNHVIPKMEVEVTMYGTYYDRALATCSVARLLTYSFMVYL